MIYEFLSLLGNRCKYRPRVRSLLGSRLAPTYDRPFNKLSRPSSSAAARADAVAAASVSRRACRCYSPVGGRPGSGGGSSVGVLSTSLATASRILSSG